MQSEMTSTCQLGLVVSGKISGVVLRWRLKFFAKVHVVLLSLPALPHISQPSSYFFF